MGAPVLSDYLWPDVSQGRQPQGIPFKLDAGNQLTAALQLLLVKSAPQQSLMTSLLQGANTGGGYGTSGVSQSITPYGVFQTHGGGGYEDDATLASGSIATDAYGLFGFCVFYCIGSAASQLFHISSVASGEDDGTVTLNAGGTLTISANGNISTTTGAVVGDGLHSVVFGNDRTNGIQELWLDGVKTNTWSSTAQSGFALNYLKTGQNASGNVSIGMAGMGLGRGALYGEFAKALAANPWQLFATPESISFAAAASGGGATATPSGVSAASAIGTPVAIGSATASPAGVSATSAIGTPVATDAVIVTPTGVQAASAIGTPTASGAATASPAGVQAASAIGTPTGAGAANAFPSGVQATSSIGTPVATGSGASATASPAGVQATSSIGIPVAGGGATAYLAGVLATSAIGIPRPVAQPQVFGEPMISTSAPRNWTAASQARNWTSRSAPRNWTTSKD